MARTRQLHSPAAPATAIHWTIWGAAIIIAMTLVAYLPAMAGGFIWDDDAYVTDNALLHDLDGLRRIWVPRQTPQYYPIVFTMFWVEHHIWGNDATGYHIMNVFLHIVNALLVWRLAAVLRIPGGAAAAWLVGCIFAVHPVHVESVAWITERKNVLSAFFYLTAALAYWRFDRYPNGQRAFSPRRWHWCLGAFALFLLALLSKSVTCSLPAALILMMLYANRPITLARLAPLAPFFIAGLILALHTAHLEREHVGASGENFAFTFADRLIIASQALLFYPTKILFPWPLIFIYPRWIIDSSSLIAFWAVGVVVVMAIAAIISYRLGRRGPALALAYFAGTIFPALGFFNIYPMQFSFVADHFQYLASLGIIVLIVGGAAHWLRSHWQLLAAAVVPLVALWGLTLHQAGLYRDVELLWRHTLSWNEASWMPHNNLSKALLKRAIQLKAEGRTAESQALFADGFDHLCRAIELNPPLEAATVAADRNVRLLLGAYFAKRGMHDRSAAQYQAFLIDKPQNVQARAALADSLRNAGQLDSALAEYRRALSDAASAAEREAVGLQFADCVRQRADQLAADRRFDQAIQRARDAAALLGEYGLIAPRDELTARIAAYESDRSRAP